MADNIYNRVGDNSLVTLVNLIKGKIDALKAAIEAEIPEIDSIITQSSSNAASSAAVYNFVKSELAEVSGLSFKIVDALPQTGESKYIYLVSKAAAAEQNIYDEYIWYNNAWEKIGSTEIDLSGYVKASEMHELTAEEITTIFNSVWGE